MLISVFIPQLSFIKEYLFKSQSALVDQSSSKLESIVTTYFKEYMDTILLSHMGR